MDALINAAARCLAAGDALGALQRVALRDDPPALALRGIAMAQLGEHPRARDLLRRAAKGFGPKEAVARARCVVAEAEVALAMRDLGEPARPLLQAAETLEAHDDRANALLGRWIAARRLILLGRLDEATRALPSAEPARPPPLLAAMAGLTTAELALRSLRSQDALTALDAASAAARRSGVPALIAEADAMRALLDQPVARRIDAGTEHPLRLAEVEELLRSPALVVDACRRAIRGAGLAVDLARRPVLFTLARALAEAGPAGVERSALILRAFRARHPDETHRARLRVELGRLRALLAPVARVDATADGFALRAGEGHPVTVLVPPIEGESAALLALLADGTAWSTSALALALGASQRTVQRALAALEAEGRVRALGLTRARRWLAPPMSGFATILLLPALPPSG
ncbi:helix-turn-helix domain-containing protein [Roseateles chitinivorans]|uniref:Helix-turn-helix domain-containing protein n=1 Tax=Roseateles chitinivorans TaxID=2917965 RepID=A0A2G9CDK1_9BURK|nr:helix-turn-helix domain-containing protein [Roseateles chitinivorans]PIM54487.1 helix-turn-helix domain-containing protein [Roseateles chitinivorans]